MDIEFGTDKQKLLIEYLLTDEILFQRSYNIIKPAYFEKHLQPAVRFILDHANKFNALPTLKQIAADTGIIFEKVQDIRNQDQEWVLKNVEKFCQRGAIVQAVYKAPDYIDVGDFGAVERIVKEATVVGLQRDLGVSYFQDPRTRLERMRQKDLFPTGYHAIDKKLYGGLNHGEITIFTAASGGGKSLFLQNICLNWVEGASYLDRDGVEHRKEPLTVVYITLELSEDLVSKRIDTMVTGIGAREIFGKIDEVELRVKMKAKECGELTIKYLPGGSTVNDIKAYLKEFEIQKGRKPDALAVDYLDLLHPISKKINVSELFIKDKYITEELRSLAVELDLLCVTASQLNRGAVDQTEHNHAMIAGGLSKIQTADNVVSIYMSPSMRERGEYQCQFLKTRSSAGVDHKVLLSYDETTLRIGNMAEDEMLKRENNVQVTEVKAVNKSNSQLLKQIKQKPVRTEETNIDSTVDNNGSSEEASKVVEVLSPTERLRKLQDKNLL